MFVPDNSIKIHKRKGWALSAMPPTIGIAAFHYGSNLIVGCGNKEEYEATNWFYYFVSIEEDCSSHDVIIDENSIVGGEIIAPVSSTELGDEVLLTITPDEGMGLTLLVVSNANNPEQTVPFYPLGKTSSLYGFIMPPFDVVITATFSPNTAIGENNEISESVYPNPTNGQVKIEAMDLKHITISNMLGQCIYEGNAIGNAFEYDFSKHKAGIYLIRIKTESGVVTKKVSVPRWLDRCLPRPR